jgi:hypothetical protein
MASLDVPQEKVWYADLADEGDTAGYRSGS